ncbi:MAG: hypothetical protein SFZ23_15730 [Planctomycetota bacterium]|nr:hypothetical protein [Planctomycetota bacterium]
MGCNRVSFGSLALLALATSTAAFAQDSVSDKATFAISDTRATSDRESGFLSGLRGFEHFYDPIGNPLYFETPLNNSSAKLLFLRHDFPSDSQLQGGDLTVVALQLRLALTERLGFIATKDGYSWLNADGLPEDEGWNSIAAGLKYAFYVDEEADLIATGGFRYMFDVGTDGILQSGVQELSPFISLAKGFDKLHLMANLTDRIPLDSDDGNNVLQWDLHADYEVADGIAPTVELHSLHYLSDGERFPLKVGGLDYTNLGSNDVSGSTVISLGGGCRFKLSPHMSIGVMYEYPLTNPDADIHDGRFTADLILTW